MIRIELFEGALLRRFGEPNGRKVLCLHGFADDGTAFTPLADTALAAEYEVIACDLPGFGASEPPRGEATLDAYASFARRLADFVSARDSVGLLAHSIGSPIAVRTATAHPHRFSAIMSLEGNLTEADAYFSGRAVNYDNPHTFKQAFSDAVWDMAQTEPSMRRYFGAVRMSDPHSMWELGRDAVRLGRASAFGDAYCALNQSGTRSLYVWARNNTPASTAAFVDAHEFDRYEYTTSGHWKTVDAPRETGELARTLFSDLYTRH